MNETKQVGGNHYSDLAIDPYEYCHKNNIGPLECAIIKYVTRHKKKGGREDLEKAIHTARRLIGLEYSSQPEKIAYKGVEFDWSKVNKRWNWIACDSSGLWWLYEQCPGTDGVILHGNGRRIVAPNQPPPSSNWKSSIKERPEV